MEDMLMPYPFLTRYNVFLLGDTFIVFLLCTCYLILVFSVVK